MDILSSRRATSPDKNNKNEQQKEIGKDFYERYFEKDIAAKLSNTEKTSKIAAAITCATALGGSDGSMENSNMTAGWSIETREGNTCRLSGAGMVDGVQSTNDSNRAERGGRIGILAVILKIAKIHEIQRGHVKNIDR